MSVEPSMEEILSSIKRIIAEEGEGSIPARARRPQRPAPASVDSSDDDEVLELSDPIAVASESTPEGPRAESILSPRTAEASRGSLDALSRMIVKPEAGGDGTLEGLVREMLRPMLRDWLDTNLPPMVETMVAKEIARIAGQG